VCLRVEGLDAGDCGRTFRWRAGAHVYMGTMLCQAGDGVVAAAAPSVSHRA
jgi:hypothetical protein